VLLFPVHLLTQVWTKDAEPRRAIGPLANQAPEHFAPFISVKPQAHVVNSKETPYVPHRKLFASIINTS
jgi:hypothetical protein